MKKAGKGLLAVLGALLFLVIKIAIYVVVFIALALFVGYVFNNALSYGFGIDFSIYKIALFYMSFIILIKTTWFLVESKLF